MELARVHIGLPVLKIEVRIFHATPRPPTAIERVLLRIHDRFRNDTNYNNIPLEHIFADFLGVADPVLMLASTLQELITLGIIRCQGDIETMDSICLLDIEITERGQRMLAEDMLPAIASESIENFYFDPISMSLLLSTDQSGLHAQEPTYSFDANVFLEMFPEEQIRAQLLRDKYTWRNPACKIEQIERQSVAVLWRDTHAHLSVEQGELQIRFKQMEVTTYINSLSSDELYHRLIDPALGIAQYSEANLKDFPVCGIEEANGDIRKWVTLSQTLNDFPASNRVWLVDGNSSLVLCPDHAGRCQTIICFNPSIGTEDIVVKWNEARDGCLVIVRDVYPLQDTLFASHEYIFRGRRVRLKVGRDEQIVPLVLFCSATGDVADISDTLDRLAIVLRSLNIDDCEYIPAFWEDEEKFWRNYANRVVECQSGLAEKLLKLDESREKFERIVGGITDKEWDSTFIRVVSDHFESSESQLDADELRRLITSISQCGINDSDHISVIVNAVTARTVPPSSLEAFLEIATIYNSGGPLWHIPFPSPLYTPAVMKAIADEYPKSQLSKFLINDNSFDKGFFQLLQTQAAIDTAIGGDGVVGLNTEESYNNLTVSPNVLTIVELIEAWVNQFNLLREMHRDLEAYLHESSLATISKQMTNILLRMASPIEGLDPKFRTAFVLDTCALLLRPDILNDFRSHEYLLVSKRVIEELDDKKLDENLRQNVATVTRALQRFPKHQIEFCDGDLSLLSPDYRMKGDNLILSVAVKYKKYRPVLLTNDNNLTLKAKAEGIVTMSVEQFERRPMKT